MPTDSSEHPYAHGSDNARERSSESPPESPPESSPKSPPESSPNGYYGYAGYPTHARPRDSLDLIKREKWIILLSIVATTAIALAYNSTLEAEYESSALLMIYPDKQMSGQIDLSSGGLLSRGEHSMSNELIVLRSSLPIARKVASRLLDMEQRDELTVVHDGNGNTLGVAEIAKRLQWGYIRVQSEGRDADVVRVTAISSAAAEAAILANLYSEEYVNLTQEASRASLTASRKYLEDQLAVRREQLRVIENETQAYMTRTGAISLDSEGERLVKQIGELETLRDEARVDLQMREASLRERERELEELYPQLSRGISSALGAEITKAQENLVELELARNRLVLARDGLTDAADGKLSDLDGEIDARRRQLEALSTQYVDEVMAGGGIDLLSGPEGRRHITDLNRQIVNDRVATTGLQAKIQVVEARLREQESKLQELPEQSIKLAQLQRDRLSAERMYAAVVERLQELRIAEESKLGYATIIREALAPSAPARPNKRKNIALGLLAGIALGLAGATARRRRDTCLYSLDDARRATGNVIGAIPDMHRDIRSRFGGDNTIEVNGRKIGTGVVTLVNSMSPAAEAFRHVRTNIRFSCPETAVQTIVVTSACPGEGKTTTAANIAVVMAQAGRRTLLLDADLRCPKVHQLFGRPSNASLVTLMSSPELVDDLELTASGIDNLHVLAVERGVDHPAELLGSSRMHRLLQRLRQVYDVIVIDTPPVLAATDAALLAAHCDVTVVVARAGMTEMADLEYCMTLLNHVDAHVVGGVLNGFDTPKKYAYRYGAGRDVRRLPAKTGDGEGSEEIAELIETDGAWHEGDGACYAGDGRVETGALQQHQVPILAIGGRPHHVHLDSEGASTNPPIDSERVTTSPRNVESSRDDGRRLRWHY